jgi:hypothetical protein
MAYVVPVAADLRARFPEFTVDSVDDATVTAFINFAVEEGAPDPTVWSEKDYTKAIIFLAAHFMSLWKRQVAADQQAGGGAGSGADSSVATFVDDIEFEGFVVRYGNTKANTSINTGGAGSNKDTAEQQLGKTMYGVLYLNMLHRNIVPMLVV